MWPNINTSAITLMATTLILVFDSASLSEQRLDLTGVWAEIARIFHFQKECPTCLEIFNNITNTFTLESTNKDEVEKSDKIDHWSQIFKIFNTFNKECPSCMEFLNNNTFIENLLLTSRLEAIKKSILEGLGMTEPPKVNASLLSLPIPIKNGDILKASTHNQDEENENASDKHPSGVVIVSSGTACKEKEFGYDVTFKIEIPWNVHSGELTGAKLWLYTDKETNINKCNLYSRPCGGGTDPDYFNDVYIDGNDFKDGWTQLDISSPFNNWLEYEELCQEITVNCNDQINEFYRSAYYNESLYQPFITVDLSPYASVNRNRNKRNINCVSNSTECCREKLVVSFADIKWDDWIIQPETYDAYYCRGKCDEVATVSLAYTPYNSVIHKLRMNSEITQKFPDLRSCCAPKLLSPLQIYYINQNGTVIKSVIPNMTVATCACT